MEVVNNHVGKRNGGKGFETLYFNEDVAMAMFLFNCSGTKLDIADGPLNFYHGRTFASHMQACLDVAESIPLLNTSSHLQENTGCQGLIEPP